MQRVLFIQDVILACLLSQILLSTAAPWMRDQWDSLSATEEVADGPIDLPFSEFDIDIDLSSYGDADADADARWQQWHPCVLLENQDHVSCL